MKISLPIERPMRMKAIASGVLVAGCVVISMGASDSEPTTASDSSRATAGLLTWHLRNTNGADEIAVTSSWGLGSSVPIAGDWAGNGTFTKGVVSSNVVVLSVGAAEPITFNLAE